jgi:hypothetical protein
VANNKNPNQKQPGEKDPGTFHYNPGNMSGKKIGKESEDQTHSDKIQNDRERRDQKR